VTEQATFCGRSPINPMTLSASGSAGGGCVDNDPLGRPNFLAEGVCYKCPVGTGLSFTEDANTNRVFNCRSEQGAVVPVISTFTPSAATSSGLSTGSLCPAGFTLSDNFCYRNCPSGTTQSASSVVQCLKSTTNRVSPLSIEAEAANDAQAEAYNNWAASDATAAISMEPSNVIQDILTSLRSMVGSFRSAILLWVAVGVSLFVWRLLLRILRR
jgi:hypothetical protein